MSDKAKRRVYDIDPETGKPKKDEHMGQTRWRYCSVCGVRCHPITQEKWDELERVCDKCWAQAHPEHSRRL